MERWIKEYLYCLYLVIAFGISLMPLLAMGVHENNSDKEKRILSSIPQICDEEGFNWNYLQEIGKYYEDHFAFRQELVTMDSEVKAHFFGVSPISDVIVGKNDWLYYTATLDDFQHKNLISDRMLFNIAHDVSMMQQYTESLGKKFLFTVAPNKNSLYGENMPERLSYHIAEKSDIERLKPWLEKEEVNYVDLFELFSDQDETLYYKRDSHWNQKGAVMVYNVLLENCNKEHRTYDDSDVLIINDYYGDLNLMLFPTNAKPEKNIFYMDSNVWRYHEGESVEDTMIVTECEAGSQNLLMYRDSFGNSLVPLLAGEFSQAVFSKKVPYTLTDLVTYSPDIVILEKVERHLQTLGKVPPVMSAPRVELKSSSVVVESSTEISVSKEGSYLKVVGTVDNSYMDVDSRIFVKIDYTGDSKVYEAFCIGMNEGDISNDYGFALYLSEVMFEGDILDIKVLTETEGQIFLLKEWVNEG